MRKSTLVLVIASVVAILAVVGATVRAQRLGIQPVPPRVLSGPDVGFRVEGLRGNTPVGTIVVRVNGEWVEAEIGVTQGVRPGTK